MLIIETERDIDRMELVQVISAKVSYGSEEPSLMDLLNSKDDLANYLNRYYDVYTGLLPDKQIVSALKFYAQHIKESKEDDY